MNLSNPKVKVPATKWELLFHFLSLVVMLSTIVYAIYQYESLPDRIPTYFNAQGEADGWGSKSSIFILPVITALTFILLYFLTKAPHIFNLPVTITEDNAPRIYSLARTMMAVFNFEIVLILSYATWSTIQATRGESTLGVGFILFTIFVPLITMILFIIKMNRSG
ncbi:DUF1648 domain-containing protein [Virgibacillus ihumii]|uniref:DUF1648 domain-containing protein n=1 Tax=Virgibacillus ihumii TaxID=2686091 RepID=UPI00157D1289|nr:DUF1648 domain-containing protein [Virgibacillus ihumii]